MATPANLEYSTTPVSHGQWCDYCPCCWDPAGKHQWFAPTNDRYECADGTHICSVCFDLEPCGFVPRGPHGQGKRKTAFFCDKHPFCEHKPKLAEHELMKLRQTKDG